MARHVGAFDWLATSLGALDAWSRVSDDGCGFDGAASADGQGLTNLCDRLGALGGQAKITSFPPRRRAT
jgi:glucose-6-phosphate-specific signal transduction histidine kinase